MADALRFAIWLPVAVAAAPAAAEPQGPTLTLSSTQASRDDPPTRSMPRPNIELRLLQEQEEAWPEWIFSPRPADRGRRGWSFGVRPGRGLKAASKIRF